MNYPAQKLMLLGLTADDIQWLESENLRAGKSCVSELQALSEFPRDGAVKTQSILLVHKRLEAELDDWGHRYVERNGRPPEQVLLYRPPDIEVTCGGSRMYSEEISRNDYSELSKRLWCPFVDDAVRAASAVESFTLKLFEYGLFDPNDSFGFVFKYLEYFRFPEQGLDLKPAQIRFLIENDLVFQERFADELVDLVTWNKVWSRFTKLPDKD